MPFALYLLGLVVFAMGTSEFMLAGLVPDISRYFGLSVGTAGLLTSAFAAGMVIGAPVMAAFTRRLPVKATLLGCVIGFAPTPNVEDRAVRAVGPATRLTTPPSPPPEPP